MIYHDNTYLELVAHVLENGYGKGDRTGTGTLSTFAQQMRFPLFGNSIPLLTTKKMHTKSIIHELLWFLKGETNIKSLQENGVSIWDEWADENGDLGPVYGKQWRDWESCKIVRNDHDSVQHEGGAETIFNATVIKESIDQVADVINKLRNNPDDRRMIVGAWNVGEVAQMALPPCHLLFQFYSRELTRGERMTIDGSGHWDANHDTFDLRGIPRRGLSCMMYQRSCDVGLGVPFNVVQYSILTHMIAQVTGHAPIEFVWTGCDVHVYHNHVEKLTEQLERDPYPSPKLLLNTSVKEIDDFVFDDFEITEYESHPTIKMDVSV